jgi:antirestriction protein ArdC
LISAAVSARARKAAVFSDTFTRAEIDLQTGEERPQEIHYMKGYTVFNVEQIDGPATYGVRDMQSVRGRSERPYIPDAPIRQKTQYVAKIDAAGHAVGGERGAVSRTAPAVRAEARSPQRRSSRKSCP